MEQSPDFEVSRGPNWRLYDYTNDLTSRQYSLARPRLDTFKVGETIRLQFEVVDASETPEKYESMWVEITDIQDGGRYSGRLDNTPAFCESLQLDEIINFTHDSIFPVQADDETADLSTINPLTMEEKLELMPPWRKPEDTGHDDTW
jgi:hypothetical protein